MESSAGKKTYITLEKEGIAEIIEKKSLFIGYAKPVKSEEEALGYISEIKKRHSDATHNVYAYYISENNIMRFSDDGEPQGTAGIPVLDVIRKGGFCDAVIVVTRYFGGTLLGKGGLIRAYSAAAARAVEVAKIVTYGTFTEISFSCGYSEYQKILYELEKYRKIIDNTFFSADVTLDLAIDENECDKFLKFLTEISGGKIAHQIKGQRFSYLP